MVVGKRVVLWLVTISLTMVAGFVCAPPAAAALGVTSGWDSFRRLDRLPYLNIGAQTLQSSSYDWTGGNDDTGGCLRRGGAGCVVAEDEGSGEIDSIWFTMAGGDVTGLGAIRIELDGRTVVNAPLQSVVDGMIGAPFVYPLVANRDQSPGAVYIKVPMPFQSSMRVNVARKAEWYHVTYRHFAAGIGLAPFDPGDRAEDVLALLRAADRDDFRHVDPAARWSQRQVDVAASSRQSFAEGTGSGKVAALRLRLPTKESFTELRLRIAFDGRELVDAPIGEFFGLGLGTEGAIAVRSLMFTADPRPNGWLSAWWPMPFARDFHISLYNTGGTAIEGIETETAVVPDPLWAVALGTGAAGYFTARSHAGTTTPDTDWTFAEESGRGKFVGVNHTMSGRRVGVDGAPFLEGDERVYLDGASSPQIHGTGTEDFYEGGFYFANGRRYSLPLTGATTTRIAEPGCAGYCLTAYRLMVADAVDYTTALRFGIEHGPVNDEQAEYGSTAFLYTR
ncbi:glycoside hydrolase family 172 protein [Nocardia colli]|uniref:glycoside hydrolase family 172 protein n=1 Tax=Nocardia colli TaxID=2545717 RepID=UPI0035E241BD